jgi:hypothetical protein
MKNIRFLTIIALLLVTNSAFSSVLEREDFLDDGPQEGKQKLHVKYAIENVARNNNPPAAFRFLNNKYEITKVNDTEHFAKARTPLHWIFNKKFLTSIDENNQDHNRYKIRQRKVASALKALLYWGADVNAQDHKGNTALHYAMEQENLDAVLLLINAGADSNIQNNVGDTPLMLVIKKVRSMQEHAKDDPFSHINPGIDAVVAEILKSEPDITISNYNDESVFTLLASTEQKENDGLLFSFLTSTKQKKAKSLKGSIRGMIEEYELKQKSKRRLKK